MINPVSHEKAIYFRGRNIPEEILLMIFKEAISLDLSPKKRWNTVSSLRLVCKTFMRIINDKELFSAELAYQRLLAHKVPMHSLTVRHKPEKAFVRGDYVVLWSANGVQVLNHQEAATTFSQQGDSSIRFIDLYHFVLPEFRLIIDLRNGASIQYDREIIGKLDSTWVMRRDQQLFFVKEAEELTIVSKEIDFIPTQESQAENHLLLVNEHMSTLLLFDFVAQKQLFTQKIAAKIIDCRLITSKVYYLVTEVDDLYTCGIFSIEGKPFGCTNAFAKPPQIIHSREKCLIVKTSKNQYVCFAAKKGWAKIVLPSAGDKLTVYKDWVIYVRRRNLLIDELGGRRIAKQRFDSEVSLTDSIVNAVTLVVEKRQNRKIHFIHIPSGQIIRSEKVERHSYLELMENGFLRFETNQMRVSSFQKLEAFFGEKREEEVTLGATS